MNSVVHAPRDRTEPAEPKFPGVYRNTENGVLWLCANPHHGVRLTMADSTPQKINFVGDIAYHVDFSLPPFEYVNASVTITLIP